MSALDELELSPEAVVQVDRVNAMMAHLYRSDSGAADAVEFATPLDALLAKEGEQTEDDYAAGVAMLVRFLDFVFARGAHPKHAVSRLYAVVRALKPSLIKNMTGEQVATIFNQTRAAESARLAMLAGMEAKVGFRHPTFRVQKSATAKAKMRRAQMGNQNRKGGKRKGRT